MSSSSVITNEETKRKTWMCKDRLLQTEICHLKSTSHLHTPTVSDRKRMCRYPHAHHGAIFFVNIETMEITDSISEALMQTVIYNARILMKEPGNYNARAEIMWAGSLSHNGLTGCGTGGGDWSCHQLEHELGGVYNVTHGAGLAAIWGSWARYVYEVNPERFCSVCHQCI